MAQATNDPKAGNNDLTGSNSENDPPNSSNDPAASAKKSTASTIDSGKIYQSIAAARNTDATLRWSRAQIFLVINSSAVAVIGFILHATLQDERGSRTLAYAATLGLSVFGLSISILWLTVTFRANRWVDFWNKRLKIYEDVHHVPSKLRVFSHPSFAAHDWHAPSFHHTLVWLAGWFIGLWLCVFLISAILTVSDVRTRIDGWLDRQNSKPTTQSVNGETQSKNPSNKK